MLSCTSDHLVQVQQCRANSELTRHQFPADVRLPWLNSAPGERDSTDLVQSVRPSQARPGGGKCKYQHQIWVQVQLPGEPKIYFVVELISKDIKVGGLTEVVRMS